MRQPAKAKVEMRQPAKRAKSIKPGAQAPGSRKKSVRAREAADSVQHHALSPAPRAQLYFNSDPGACAPGFMLSLASRALLLSASRTQTCLLYSDFRNLMSCDFCSDVRAW